MSVLCHQLPGDTATIETPRVVAEVLSPSTRTYDLIEKRAAYRKLPSLQAYVIVHTALQHVEVDLRDGNDRWVTSTFERDGLPFGNGTLALEDIYIRSSLSP